jgi:hypothetical protein
VPWRPWSRAVRRGWPAAPRGAPSLAGAARRAAREAAQAEHLARLDAVPAPRVMLPLLLDDATTPAAARALSARLERSSPPAPTGLARALRRLLDVDLRALQPPGVVDVDRLPARVGVEHPDTALAGPVARPRLPRRKV